ncbi:hypothetical protein ALDI51_08040 [Alicycliphilus denitrificans]|nr:hypothetical protein ALDI51_08040 [Alicycliphilus denitrificans]
MPKATYENFTDSDPVFQGPLPPAIVGPAGPGHFVGLRRRQQRRRIGRGGDVANHGKCSVYVDYIQARGVVFINDIVDPAITANHIPYDPDTTVCAHPDPEGAF